MRADRPLETKIEYEKQVSEAPKDQQEALLYWLEKCAFWLYQIHSQNAILMRRDEVRQRYRRDKEAGKNKSNPGNKETYYCIELYPAVPANISLELIRRNMPRSGEPYHIQRASNVKEAKALIETRLNEARAKDPNAMPGRVTIRGMEDDHGEEF